MQKDKRHISFIKGISWRLVGTLDTMMLSYFFTGSISSALKIGSTEVFTKILFFYLHERLWFRIKWGLTKKENLTADIHNEENIVWEESHIRSIIKGISWRIVGTLDTILIATFWTHDYSKALKIGLTEVVTKIIFFYIHERIWMHFTRKNATETEEA